MEGYTTNRIEGGENEFEEKYGQSPEKVPQVLLNLVPKTKSNQVPKALQYQVSQALSYLVLQGSLYQVPKGLSDWPIIHNLAVHPDAWYECMLQCGVVWCGEFPCFLHLRYIFNNKFSQRLLRDFLRLLSF